MLLIVLSLASCASNLPQDEFFSISNKKLYSILQDDLFIRQSGNSSIEKIELLDLPASTKSYLDLHIAPLETEKEQLRALRVWVFDEIGSYEYDAYQTLSTVDLINIRKINCLSFSSMFVAAARYLDLPAKFQLVYAPPYWDSRGNTSISNQHVNVFGEVIRPSSQTKEIGNQFCSQNKGVACVLTEGEKKTAQRTRSKKLPYVMDLNRAVVSIPYKTKYLKDYQLHALFYTNKSTEELLEGNLVDAYLYAKEALLTDRYSVAAWNSIGVLFRKTGQLGLAEEAYKLALRIGEETDMIKGNLAVLYRQQGKVRNAELVENEIAEHRESNPYYHHAIGEKLLVNNNSIDAEKHFRVAIGKKHNEQLFHYSLAKAQAKLGKYDAAKESLKNASIYSRGAEKLRYSSKLEQFELALAQRKEK